MDENTHRLDVRNNMGRLVLAKSWMRKNTYVLDVRNNTRTIKYWQKAECMRTRTSLRSDTTQRWGQPLTNRWMHENTHNLDVGNNMGRSTINKQLDA